MAEWLTSGAIGLASGVLSGMFGIGGGILTTPAIRLLMGAPALIAVGTPLPVIFPSAVTGAWAYRRRGLADVRAGLVLGFSGALTAVVGAWATKLAGGSAVLTGTAALIAFAAGDMLLQFVRPPRADSAEVPVPAPLTRLVLFGMVTGLYSGFFGLGGGFVLVPLLTRWLRFPIKRAMGTSLIAVALLAVPGTLTHAVLGHIDWTIAGGLTLGVIPGALLGARLNAAAHDRYVTLAFAVLLTGVAIWLGLHEIGLR